MLHPDLVAVAPSQRRIGSALEARQFIAEMHGIMESLEDVIARETNLIKSGKVRDALSLEREKSDKSGQYLRFMQTMKANAILIARFAPAEIDSLKQAHGRLTSLLALNQQVLATVKSISENLVRGVQEETSATRALSTYGPGASVARHTPAHAPLALSVQL